MLPHSIPAEDALKYFRSDGQNGLRTEQVTDALQTYGENRLPEKKKKSGLQRFLAQFQDVMILILLAAALVSFGIACYHRDPADFFEPALIVLIVLLNAAMGVLQESKAERALNALRGLSAPRARVIRDGKEQILDASALVPGDVIVLEAGDEIPADARLLRSAALKCEESALTGESVPSDKDANSLFAENAPLGDRSNMVYSGCTVTYGRGTAVVIATGVQTEMGKIAALLSGTDKELTPLQKKLAELGKKLGILALAACAVIFTVGLLDGMPVLEIFMTSVSLAVSAIPEGLPAIVTIVLSIGVERMVSRNAIIRSLPAVETLGSASVICSDKTGTLTQNRMTLVEAFVGGESEPEPISDHNSPAVRRLLQLGALCCDGAVLITENGTQHIGDPTETAIVYAAYRNGMKKEELTAAYPRLAELPFDSDRKRMATVNRIGDRNIVVVKGAFDGLAPLCIKGDLERASACNDAMSGQALRVLALAYKEIETLPEEPTTAVLETELHFLGLVGMIDPPRAEAADAVAICQKAGIRPVMITGDHVVTASAIASSLGILRAGDQAVTGAALDAMSEAELDEQVEKISVYARVSPENKIRIVQAWQRKNQVVAMTGDGVNDAPALKAADIGCAMGITGTDVAKGAADMTLSDDNFATIVEAVREGRGIFENIKKVVGYLLGTNIGEVLTVFFSMILWHASPLLSMQLLWINLVTDSLPAIALGMEQVEPGVMNRPPRPKGESIFAQGLGLRVCLQGILFGALTLTAFRVAWHATGQLAGGQTAAFIVLALSQIVQSFNMRSNRSLFRIGPFSNKKLNLAALFSTVLMLLVVFTPVYRVFGLIRLSAPLYWMAFGLCLVPLFIMELSKAVGWNERTEK